MAASLGDQNGSLGLADFHDSKGGGGGGDWFVGLSGSGEGEVGEGVESVDVWCV